MWKNIYKTLGLNYFNTLTYAYIFSVPQVLSRIKYGYNMKYRQRYLKLPFSYNITWAKGKNLSFFHSKNVKNLYSPQDRVLRQLMRNCDIN